MGEKEQLLNDLMLTQSEIKVYLHLLGVQQADVSTIARAVESHRPPVVAALNDLKQKGLVEITGEKRKYYVAVTPKVLIERAEQLLVTTKAAVPKLFAEQLRKLPQQSMRVLEGEEGLAACFLDVASRLNKGDTFYRISSASDQHYVDSVVPAEYRPLRDAKQLERRVITSRYVGKMKKPRLERTIRYFDESDALFEHNVIQFIYGDTVSLLDFNSLTATIIRNQALADFQRSIFAALYKRLPAKDTT